MKRKHVDPRLKYYLNRIGEFLFSPFNDFRFIYLFVIAMIGGMCVLFSDFTASIFNIIIFNCLLAYLLVLLFHAVSHKFVQTIIFSLEIIIVNFLTITDVFLVVNFHEIISSNTFFIAFNSNRADTAGFIDTYFSFPSIILYGIIIIASNIIIFKLSEFLICRIPKWIKGVFCAVCLLYFAFLVCSVFLIFTTTTGFDISKYSSASRLVQALLRKNETYQNAISIMYKCKDINKLLQYNPEDSTVYVIVIGESHSKFHSEPYGYSYTTMPRTTKRIENDEMLVFSNCVSPQDGTYRAMSQIFSLSPSLSDFGNYAIFPAVFKAAGYKSLLFDNQFLDGGFFFMDNKDVSDVAYDYRNNELKDYDSDLVDDMMVPSSRALVIVNLNGQHYTYKDRIPPCFELPFSPADYNGRNSNEAQVLADYDNSIYYTDYVINLIISKFEDYNACLIYFSDHGEEVFDQDDFMGHGRAKSVENKDYLIQIPFFIWGSSSFRDTDKWQRIQRAKDLPVSTNDFAQSIIDLADIYTDGADLTRSFFNERYDASRHRIVLEDFDYDQSKENLAQ